MACSGNVFTVHRRPKNLRNLLLFLHLLHPPLRFLRDFVPPRVLTACVFLVVILASLLPLMMARTASFPKAGQFCSEQKAQINPAAEPALGDSLNPVHLSNCLSMFSCGCLGWVVLHRSPHLNSSSDQARTLDKKCASISPTFSTVAIPFCFERLRFPSNLSLSRSTCLCPLLCGHTRHSGSGTERMHHFDKKTECFHRTDCRTSLLLLHLEQKHGRALLPV